MHFGWKYHGANICLTVEGYPQSISTKYGPSSLPFIDAVECDIELTMMYLLYQNHQNLFYSYTWLEDTTLRDHNYTIYTPSIGTLSNMVSSPLGKIQRIFCS